MLSEKIQLLGGSVYSDIPAELTLKSMPTSTELDYVGSEDFERVMIDKVLPQCIEEKINFKQLLEIDFHWICRCLRFMNYGPYYTTNTIYCPDCDQVSKGEYRVDLRGIECKPLPEDFVNSVVIPKDTFIDYDGDVTVSLPTVGDMMNAHKDKMFMRPGNKTDNALARLCYSIKGLKNEKNLTPINVKLALEKDFSAADMVILKDEVSRVLDYGLRAGGSTICPVCGSHDAAYIALVDDRFLRPTVGDLREWKRERRPSGNKA